MGFLNKLFKKEKDSAQPAAGRQVAQADPREDPNLMQFFDEYGREIFFTREQWRKDILPGNLKSNWNDADALSGLIVNALNDGFAAEVLAAGKQLYRLDGGSLRGTCIYAIVLMQNNRLEEAEKLLLDYLREHGDDGVLLTNLAKVYAAQERQEEAEATLWRALELDPNQENGFGWYEAIHRERDGEAAGLEATRRVAALPGSWRAQIWLARAALKANDLAKAIEYYQQCLARTSQPVPADVLMQISGDLGNNHHLAELLQLVEPQFDVEIHGLTVGNNLVKAHLELNQIEAAKQIVEHLHAQKRPDWKEHLHFWDTEIARVRIASSTTLPDAQLEVALQVIEGPVWLPPTSPLAALFGEKPPNVPVVGFFGSSAELPHSSPNIEKQLADAPGILSRSLPLFLAERVEFGTGARSRTFLPSVEGEGGGLVLLGKAWSDDEVLNFARGGSPCDYVVITHLQCQTTTWAVEMRVVRTSDGTCLARFTLPRSPDTPADALTQLAQTLLNCLRSHTPLPSQPFPPLYQVPDGDYLSTYLLRLEQLLVVRTTANQSPGALYGEREIIDGNLQQCLTFPANVVVRALLAQTLLYMKKVRPELLGEFKERIEKLQRESPLAGPAQEAVQHVMDEALM